MADNESMTILETVKDMIGPSIDYDVFDDTLLVHINSFFEVLTQCGVGPQEGFHVDKDSKWEDFLTEGRLFHMAKDYIQIRTRLLFDPPASSSAVQILTDSYKEMEWRMYIQADSERRLNGF